MIFIQFDWRKLGLEKVTIDRGFDLLHEENNNKFYFEVEVVEVQEDSVTSSGNYFVRLKIKDETMDAILVVWGSKNNQTNINLFKGSIPKKIRLSTPIRPSQWAIDRYGVDFWAHESQSKVEIID